MPIHRKPAITELFSTLQSLRCHGRRIGQNNQVYADLLAERVKRLGGREITRETLVGMLSGLSATLKEGGKGIPQSLTALARQDRLYPFERKVRRVFHDVYLGPEYFQPVAPRVAEIRRFVSPTAQNLIGWVESVRVQGGFPELNLHEIRRNLNMIPGDKLTDLVAGVLNRIREGRRCEQQEFRDFGLYVEAVLADLRRFYPKDSVGQLTDATSFHLDVQRTGWNLEEGNGTASPLVKQRMPSEYGRWKVQLLRLVAAHLPYWFNQGLPL